MMVLAASISLGWSYVGGIAIKRASFVRWYLLSLVIYPTKMYDTKLLGRLVDIKEMQPT